MTTKQILVPLTVEEMRTLLAPVIPLALTRPALTRESGMAYIQVRSDGKGNIYAIATDRYVIGIQRVRESIPFPAFTGYILASDAKRLVSRLPKAKMRQNDVTQLELDAHIDGEFPRINLAGFFIENADRVPEIVGVLDPLRVAKFTDAVRHNAFLGTEVRWETVVRRRSDGHQRNPVTLSIGDTFVGVIMPSAVNGDANPRWVDDIPEATEATEAAR